jgi:O-antigen ligase
VAILVPICALATVVWGVVLVRWGSLLAVAIGVLLAGTVFGPEFYHYNGPFQVSSERILWAGLMAMFVIHWRLGKTDPKPFSIGDAFVLALMLVTGISSQTGIPVTDGSNPLARWLFYVAMPTGLYFVVRSAQLRKIDLQRVTAFMIAIGSYLAVTSFLEMRGIYMLVFPRFVSDPANWEFLGRGRGPLLNPSGIGIVMTAAIGAASMRWLDAGRAGKIGYALIVLILLAGCYATLTRCVWLGAAAALGLVTFVHLPRIVRVWLLLSSLIIGLGLGGVLVQSVLELKRDKNLSPSAAKQSVELRPLLAVIALEMFADRPLTGHGFGHYLASHKPYTQQPQWRLPLANATGYHQHNVVLSMMVDCGLAGVLPYLGFLVWTTWIAVRLAFAKNQDNVIRTAGMTTVCLMIGYLANGMFQDVTIVAMVHMYLFFFAGLSGGIWLRQGYCPSVAVPATGFQWNGLQRPAAIANARH